MLLPVELIDYIFSFLRGDTSSLITCSKTHPLLSQLAERHRYADAIINPSNKYTYEHFVKNPHILDYPRTLEIHTDASIFPQVLAREMAPIVLMIPRMANLTSLKLCEIQSGIHYFRQGFPSSLLEEFLQQSSVQQIHFSGFRDVPLSVLDNCKNIKKLTLSNCKAMGEPRMSNSPHQLLETLVIRGYLDEDLLIRMTDRVANLKSLRLQEVVNHWHSWKGFPELLAACSSSLTELHIDVFGRRSGYFLSHWICPDIQFPFTVSTHKHLKQLSISAPIFSLKFDSTVIDIECEVPAIMSLIKSAPAIRDVFLRLHWLSPNYNSLGQLDWSILQSDLPLRIHLFISYDIDNHSITPGGIFTALTRNGALMDLVKREVVILKPEHIAPGDWPDTS